jgi:hypothetical protein
LRSASTRAAKRGLPQQAQQPAVHARQILGLRTAELQQRPQLRIDQIPPHHLAEVAFSMQPAALVFDSGFHQQPRGFILEAHRFLHHQPAKSHLAPETLQVARSQ